MVGFQTATLYAESEDNIITYAIFQNNVIICEICQDSAIAHSLSPSAILKKTALQICACRETPHVYDVIYDIRGCSAPIRRDGPTYASYPPDFVTEFTPAIADCARVCGGNPPKERIFKFMAAETDRASTYNFKAAYTCERAKTVWQFSIEYCRNTRRIVIYVHI